MMLHTAWAFSAYVVFTLLSEYIVPGSVMPYVDPVPLAMIALAFLACIGSMRAGRQRPIPRLIVASVIALAVFMVVFSNERVDSNTDSFAAAAVFGLLATIGIFIALPGLAGDDHA
jgi:Flp pilus assembly protein protease CpaA